MTKPTVYLAGPITGLTFDGATDWRSYATEILSDVGIRTWSPMRGKEYLRAVGELSGHGREYADLGVMSTPRAVMTRDRFDCTRCDVVLVNLLGATRVSIGTCMEIAWADLRRIPIVCAIDENNPHDHMFVNEAIGFRVPTIEDAIDVTRVMLVGY